MFPFGNEAFQNKEIRKALFPMFWTSKVWFDSFKTQKVSICNFFINEANPTFNCQNIGNVAFQNASFANGNEGYSYPWALSCFTMNRQNWQIKREILKFKKKSNSKVLKGNFSAFSHLRTNLSPHVVVAKFQVGY